MTPEKKVKNAVIEIIKAAGAYHITPATGGYGISGTPDIVGCYNGRFFAIECKAGGNTPTALQEVAIARIHKAKGAAIVVNEYNLDAVLPMLHRTMED